MTLHCLTANAVGGAASPRSQFRPYVNIHIRPIMHIPLLCEVDFTRFSRQMIMSKLKRSETNERYKIHR
jgi:hypothetical protein